MGRILEVWFPYFCLINLGVYTLRDLITEMMCSLVNKSLKLEVIPAVWPREGKRVGKDCISWILHEIQSSAYRKWQHNKIYHLMHVAVYLSHFSSSSSHSCSALLTVANFFFSWGQVEELFWFLQEVTSQHFRAFSIKNKLFRSWSVMTNSLQGRIR